MAFIERGYMPGRSSSSRTAAPKMKAMEVAPSIQYIDSDQSRRPVPSAMDSSAQPTPASTAQAWLSSFIQKRSCGAR